MKRWPEAIVLLALAAMVYLFVFNRGTRLDSKLPVTPATNSIAQARPVSEPRTAPPVTQLSNRLLTAAATINRQNSLTQIKPTAPSSLPSRPAITLPEPSEPLDELPKLSQSIVLENLRLAFRQYQNHLGGNNPVGTNEEITRALNGENPKQVRLLRLEDGMRVNAKGEIVDTWGTPYFFHQLSGTEMEIHSAGPDKKMWTSDDLVIK